MGLFSCGIKSVLCQTAAKTEAGIHRAMGKAVAKTLGTDVFECLPKAVWRDGVARNYLLSEWKTMRIDWAADNAIWEAAHDALMG